MKGGGKRRRKKKDVKKGKGKQMSLPRRSSGINMHIKVQLASTRYHVFKGREEASTPNNQHNWTSNIEDIKEKKKEFNGHIYKCDKLGLNEKREAWPTKVRRLSLYGVPGWAVSFKGNPP